MSCFGLQGGFEESEQCQAGSNRADYQRILLGHCDWWGSRLQTAVTSSLAYGVKWKRLVQILNVSQAFPWD